MRSPFTKAIIICILVAATSASAVPGAGAIILEFDTSVRNAGMGETGVANHWGGDPGMWANPSLLGYTQGARYTFFESQLAVGLADDIRLTDEYATLGLGGLGLFYGRGPVKGAYLDMGTQHMTDENGNLVGEFDAYMQAERMGAGISVFHFLETLFGADEPALSRWLDVSAGVVMTDVESALMPDELLGDYAYDGEGSCTSYGALARVTPINTLGETYAAGPLGGIRLDLAYGVSLLNDSDDLLELGEDSAMTDPFPRMFAEGWSAHLETGLPPALRSYFEYSNLGWLADSLTPLVSFSYSEQLLAPGIVWNDETQTYDDVNYEFGFSDVDPYDVESWGWELSVANIWHVRKGHVKYEVGAIDGDTEGSGIGFRLGNLGGVRWDKATVPQAMGLPSVERESFTAWVDLSRFIN